MIDSQVIAFSTIAAVLAITPGSDTLLVIKNSFQNGTRGGQSTTLGILTGILFHAIISALGLSIIIAQSEVLFKLMQGLGAAYLIWLGLQSIRTKKSADCHRLSRENRALISFFQEGLFLVD